jgi:osomolarity two-component system sensor histidine kinase NIK1
MIIDKLTPFENRTLLLMDTAGDKASLAQGLEEVGLRTFRIGSVDEVSKKDSFPHIDSIIVDSMETTEGIRALEHMRYIPVVLLTMASPPLNRESTIIRGFFRRSLMLVAVKWCVDNSISSHAIQHCRTPDLISAVFSALESSIASPTVAPSEVVFDILLAEDNQVNQKLAVKLLERYGYNIEIAENGSLAVETFKERIGEGKPFDVILVGPWFILTT